MDDRPAHLPNLQEDEEDTWMDKIRRAYEQTKSSEAIGNVLVAGTPSQSDGSQNSSRNISFPHPDASQLLNDGEGLGLIDNLSTSSFLIWCRVITRIRWSTARSIRVAGKCVPIVTSCGRR